MGDAPPEQRALAAETARFVVLTGLSGAGKSQAIHALEDLGYFCVDNLPTSLLPTLARFSESDKARLRPTAVVVDMRDPAFLDEFPEAFADLRRRPTLRTLLIFLEADDGALVQRFSETRRPHPLAVDQTVVDGIRKERTALEPVKQLADTVLDTSELTVHELRRAFRDLSRVGRDRPLVVNVVSFGYKHGVPLEADLLFDARFLPNPYFVPALRPLSGLDPAVQEYVGRAEASGPFIDRIVELLRFLVPRYAVEGKSYLTVAVGCTGGRHRSVAVAESLRGRLACLEGVRLRLRHRDTFVE